MGTITNRLSLEKPVLTDPFSTQTLADNWQTLDDAATLFVQNTLGNRPAAGTSGRFFAATDDDQMSYDDGSAWRRIPTALPGGQHLFEKGSAANPGLGFTGDDNTGLASLNADALHLVTAGRWHWRLNSTGEFGGRNFSSATASALATQQAGKSHPYWSMRVDGYMAWGSGSGAADVQLHRDAASRLRLTGGLNLTGDLHVGGDILDGPSGETVLGFNGDTVTVGVGQEQARLPTGSIASPGMAWQGDGNTGFRRRSNGTTGFVGNGTEGGYLWSGGIRTAAGSASAPSQSYVDDTNSGWYSGGNGIVRLSINGSQRLEVTSSRFHVKTPQLESPDGSEGAPGLQFSDNDTGFWHKSSLNQVGLSIDGSVEMRVGQDGIYLANAYTSETASGANLNITSDGVGPGRLRRVTSLLKNKDNVASIRKREQKVGQQATLFERGRNLDPTTFTSKLKVDGDDVMVGMIAEWTAEHVPELAVYGPDGDLQSVAYDRVGVLALAYALEALDRLDGLDTS